MKENGLYFKDLPEFGKKVTEILQKKYYREDQKIYGKKMLKG